MKISWGNKILIAIILFVILMGTLVYKSIHTQYDLVSDTYYKEELVYQKIIDGNKRVTQLKDTLLIEKNEAVLRVKFPDDLKNASLQGTIRFYSPSNVSSDRSFSIQTDSANTQLLSLNEIAKGAYVIKIEATQNGQFYYWEQNFQH